MNSTHARSCAHRTGGAESMAQFAHRRGFRLAGAAVLLVVTGLFLSCERDTTLSIKDGNPPEFVMTGSGTLSFIRLGGPNKQREGEGEEAYLYWMIKSKIDEDRPIQKLSPLAYGDIPEGYEQGYPEHGHPPPLIEEERYFVQISTFDANGVNGYLTIRNGKAAFESN